MAQGCESKPCLMFTVKKKKKEVFGSTELYAFDELFVKLEDEGGKKKSADKTSGNEVALPVSRLLNYHTNARFASINSVIYRIGGYFYDDILRRQVWIDHDKSVCNAVPDEDSAAKADRCLDGRENIEYCDMADDQCWRQGPQLNFPRISPHLLVLGGKLYVAGGFLQMPDDSAFMEILDEGEKSWCVLPNPPVAVDELDYFMSAAVDEMGVILIVTGGMLPLAFTYKPDECVWQPFDGIRFQEEIVSDHCCRPAVVVGKIALWVDDLQGTHVLGVDLSSHRSFGFDMVREDLLHTRRFPGDFRGGFRGGFPRLVSFRNGELCLIWGGTDEYALKCDDNSNREIFGAGYHCVTFRLSLDPSNRGKPCSLKVMSRKKCIGPADPDRFDDAFVVNIATPENNQSSHSSPSFTAWGIWAGLHVIGWMAYFRFMRR